MENEKPKKKQHFVSQMYLKHWGHKVAKGYKVYTFMNGKIHPQLTEAIAHERFFYEIDSLNEAEREVLLKDAGKIQTPHVGDLFRDIINGCYLIGVAEEGGASADDASINIYKKNTIENYYWLVEDVVTEAYSEVLSGKTDGISLNSYQDILRFAIYQLGRTPKARENVRKSTEEMLQTYGIRFNRWYTLSMLMTCEQLVTSCIERLCKLTVVNNMTHINYITNDNPVFNLGSMEDSSVDLFWPISPRQAIRISPYTTSENEASEIKEQWKKYKTTKRYFVESVEENDSEKINYFNGRAWDNKHRFAFALEEDELRRFM